MSKLTGKNILLTGATGGIGHCLALQLAALGANLVVVGTQRERLLALCSDIRRAGDISQAGGRLFEIVADLEQPLAAKTVVEAALQYVGNIDILINNAGLMDFILFEDQSPERIAQMVQVNVTAPISLARAVLPGFIARNNGHIVNIGSTFGSIGFPHYATYCATKFALRGFSQALRREFAETNIKVSYIAPRVVKTALNDEVTTKMLLDANMNVDEPEAVAAQIVNAISRQKQEHYIGQPESFFARLNAVLPRIVNIGLKRQAIFSRPYAARKNDI